MVLSSHKKAEAASPHLSFVPTPSQKTAVTGSENGGYLSGEEEEVDNIPDLYEEEDVVEPMDTSSDEEEGTECDELGSYGYD